MLRAWCARRGQGAPCRDQRAPPHRPLPPAHGWRGGRARVAAPAGWRLRRWLASQGGSPSRLALASMACQPGWQPQPAGACVDGLPARVAAKAGWRLRRGLPPAYPDPKPKPNPNPCSNPKPNPPAPRPPPGCRHVFRPFPGLMVWRLSLPRPIPPLPSQMDDEEAAANTRFGRFQASWFGRLPPVRHLIYACTIDVHASLTEEGHEHIAKMHANAEVGPWLCMIPLRAGPLVSMPGMGSLVCIDARQRRGGWVGGGWRGGVQGGGGGAVHLLLDS